MSLKHTDHGEEPMPTAVAERRSAWSRVNLLGSVAVVAVLLLGSLGLGAAGLHVPAFTGTPASGHGAVPTSSPAPIATPAQAVAHAAHAKTPAVPSSTPATAPTTSGRGTFFINSPIPNPPTGMNYCPNVYTCWNDTNDPSANITTYGFTGIAYTSYTNQSICPAMTGNSTTPDAITEIGFILSTNLGTTWGTPITLGNPVCTGDGANYSSAMEPSLTSLANGTFVMAYVEYNYTVPYYYYGGYAPPDEFSCNYVSYDRLVITQSYDNGSTWTTPTVVSETNLSGCPTTGFPALRPSIAALGGNLYLTWEEMDAPPNAYLGSIYGDVLFASSSDGGTTWSSPTTMTVESGNYAFSGSTSVAMNPNILVNPAGEIFIAYTTGISEVYVTNPCCSYAYQSSIYVASSTDGGLTWTTTDIQDGVGYLEDSYPATFIDTAPTMAWSTTDGQLFVAYAGQEPGSFCYNDGPYGKYCDPYYTSQTIYLQNSSDGGATWSSPRDVLPMGTFFPDSFQASAYNPSMAVDDMGRVHLQYTLLNTTTCSGSALLPYLCTSVWQFYQNSTDDGFTWTNPSIVFPNVTYFGYPSHQDVYWSGTYSSVITAGSGVLLAWTTSQCPAFATTYCNSGYSGYAEVIASQLFEGTGITLSFTESGLPATTPWGVNVQGNLRAGTAGATLSVSGIPPSVLVGYYAPWVNVSYGVSFAPTPSTSGPAAFATSTTVNEAFSEFLLVNIQSVPTLQSFAWTYAYANWNMNPTPNSAWYSAGTILPLSVSPQAWGFCYICLNMSFQSWTGSGSGSVSSTSQSISITVNGQINETANFNVLGDCRNAIYGGGCNNFTYPMVFHQAGLPTGSTWGISYVNQSTGELDEVTTTAQNITLLVTSGPLTYYMWSIPSATAGQFWLPTSSSSDPASVPESAYISITYALGTPASSTFPTVFEETGLPNNTAWSIQLNGGSFGVTSSNTTVNLPGGSTNTVNASYVYLANGTGYYASAVSFTPFVVNESATSTTAPGSFSLDGSAIVLITFSPRYYVTVASTVGGSVDTPSSWVKKGSSITLTAMADPGSYFVGWTGYGTGSQSVGTATITVTPMSAVTEIASFRPNAPATWNVTVMPVGLPSGATFTVSIGPTSYTASGAFLVGEIPTGSYNVAALTVSLNASNTTRFVPTDLSSDLSLASGVLDVVANGTLTITYTTQYTVSIAATSGGTTNPSVGSYWYNSASVFTLSATPSAGHYFNGWNGTGTGSITTPALTGLSGTVTVSSPITETALFVKRLPSPPATFWLNVTESGLPTSQLWSVAAGGYGASGTATSLTVNGLNGTYTLEIPILYTATGTRWVPDNSNVSVTATANGTASVSFSEQFLVTIIAPEGGDVTPTTQWVAPGTTISLTALANSSNVFVAWNGTGAGNYTGASPVGSFTVNGPVTEKASFGPVPSVGTTGTSSSDTTGLITSLLLLVVLLLVGAVVGLLVGRRRPPAGPGPMEPYSSGNGVVEGGDASSDAGAPMPEYDEGPVQS